MGANLPSAAFGAPRKTLEAALEALAGQPNLRVRRCSRFFKSAPQPPSDQPWFVNAVAELETALDPVALLDRLHDLEHRFGRARSVRNAPRVIDLDLLDYHGRVTAPDERPRLPHPRMAERLFVLLPLADIAPDWRHPGSGLTAVELASCLPDGQDIEPMDKGPGM
jgi:2-amino-4-hydroxy-6-hydroxymethyldihydropteridine diphosphokinase